MGRDVESSAQTALYPTREAVLGYLVERGVITPNSREAEILRVLAGLPPPLLSVRGVARALSTRQHTLGRILRRAGLPSPSRWVVLARVLKAQRVILRGGTIDDGAIAAGYYDQSGLSAVLQRTVGFRAAVLKAITWQHLIDVWITRQRRRAAVVIPQTDRLSQ